ncbi:MAG: CBS domain-containing protein [Nitrospinae bacterium]|nr:CBS domain-containing protein [Nitrospinota bacterium]
MPTVGELMKRDVATISAGATIREALSEMKTRRIKSLVIAKRSPSDAYGIIAFADIAKAIIAEDGDIDMLNVFDIASRPVVQVSENLDIKYAVRLMVNLGLKRLLVIDNNELKGILSLSDVVYHLMEVA